MALSDYLTSDEWDACFYAFHGQHHADNFGMSMRMTIDALLKTGYEFPGLDEHGNKKEQVCNGVNANKVCIWIGNPFGVDVLACLYKGREFLKKHLPGLVDETDEEWAEGMEEARKCEAGKS